MYIHKMKCVHHGQQIEICRCVCVCACVYNVRWYGSSYVYFWIRLMDECMHVLFVCTFFCLDVIKSDCLYVMKIWLFFGLSLWFGSDCQCWTRFFFFLLSLTLIFQLSHNIFDSGSLSLSISHWTVLFLSFRQRRIIMFLLFVFIAIITSNHFRVHHKIMTETKRRNVKVTNKRSKIER